MTTGPELEPSIPSNEDLAYKVAELTQQVQNISRALSRVGALDNIEIVLKQEGYLPTKGSDQAAGHDIFLSAIVNGDTILPPDDPWRPVLADFNKYSDYLDRVDPSIKPLVRDNPDNRMEYSVMLEPGQELTLGPGYICAFEAKEGFGYYSSVAERSSMARRKIKIVSGAVIDSDFRGEIAVTLRNNGSESYPLTKKMRFAQIVITRVEAPTIHWVKNPNQLSATKRGTNGHGSTGK
jgi:deoxyuridine 5'-triphosphate nucleotidohydrolase